MGEWWWWSAACSWQQPAARRQQLAGSRQEAAASNQQPAGSRQQQASSKQPATNNQQAAGNPSFVFLLFFSSSLPLFVSSFVLLFFPSSLLPCFPCSLLLFFSSSLLPFFFLCLVLKSFWSSLLLLFSSSLLLFFSSSLLLFFLALLPFFSSDPKPKGLDPKPLTTQPPDCGFYAFPFASSASGWQRCRAAVHPPPHRSPPMLGLGDDDALTRLGLALEHLVVPAPWESLKVRGVPDQDTRRHALARLDVPINARLYKDGEYIILSTPEMRQAYERRREHALGHKMLLEWAQQKSSGGLSPQDLMVPAIAVMFWHGSEVPDTFRSGVASAVLQSGLTVVLYTYDGIAGLPQGVVVKNATTVLPRDEFKAALERGVRVQHLADFIRAKALQGGVGGLSPRPGGWFVDGDSIFLNAAPQLYIGRPPQCGHFFASLDALRQRQGCTALQTARHWQIDYLTKPQDFMCIASPFAFPPGSPILDAWVSEMSNHVFGDGGLSPRDDDAGYLRNMGSLRCLVIQWGLEEAVVAVNKCSPVHRASRVSCLKPKSNSKFDMSIIKHAMCVNNLWQISKHAKDEASVAVQGSLANVDPECTWAKILELAGVARVLAKTPARKVTSKASVKKRPAAAVVFPPAADEQAAAVVFPPAADEEAAAVVFPPATSERAEPSSSLAGVDPPSGVAVKRHRRVEPVEMQDAMVQCELLRPQAIASTREVATQAVTATQSVASGEHLTGEPFLWKGIFDMT